MARGRLRVYLGSAPGVGKTFAMLNEGRRRAERGTDVVVALVETHGRRHTADQVGPLEVVPRREVEHRGASFTELDVDAVLARRPRLALVDELAHTNVPGSRNPKRWQDVEELLAAGIDVISTVNVQHLESLNDVVEKITGVAQRETVPDAFVRAADQVELVDMTPEALRRRLAHGNVYAAENVDAALGSYFRPGNLTALRELALLWVADEVDDALQRYRAEHGIGDTWEARERVVVALSGGREGEALVRRAARVAARSARGDLLAVHVTRSDGLAGASPADLAEQRRLVESLGGSFHQVLGDDVPDALLTFARAENATQLVLGVSRRSRLAALARPGIGDTTIRGSGDIDVHIVTHAGSGRGVRQASPGSALTRSRRLRGYLLAVVLPSALTLVLSSRRGDLNLVSDVLLFLLATVVVALVGGFAPALVAGIGGSVLLNYYFAPPLHELSINEKNNALALLVFVVVAVLVSSVVDLAARRTRQAVRSAAEAQTLATLAAGVVRGEAAVPALLERVREALTLSSVTLLERGDDDGAWSVVAAAGADPVERPGDADTVVACGPRLSLGLRGRPLHADDQRVVQAFAAHAASLIDRLRLAEVASEAGALAAANSMRTALLAAVGHDLRTPLATVKTVVTGLLSRDVELDEDDRRELLTSADESLDRLTALVDNLLDMSRLHAGAMTTVVVASDLHEVVGRALDDLGPAGRGVEADLPDALPLVLADAGLLERVVANLVDNALRHAASAPVRVTGSSLGGTVELRVVDRGPGIPASAHDRVFAPFQRLGDTDNTTGIGLGLALSRGLVEAMGGTLLPEETPGGGLTMVVALPLAAERPPEPGLREREAAR